MTASGIQFAPLVPAALPAGFALLALAASVWTLVARRGARPVLAALLRAAAVCVIALLLLGPQKLEQVARPLPDRLVILLDRSASMTIGTRAEQAAQAAARLAAAARDAGLEVATVPFDDRTTAAGEALRQARLAGDDRSLSAVVLIGDGLVQDPDALARSLPPGTPLHLLLAGRPDLPDRRLVLESAPRYGVVGRPVAIRLRVEQNGGDRPARVRVRMSGERAVLAEREIPVGETTELSFTPSRRGRSWITIEAEPMPGEPVRANNRATFAVDAVRDRLRVLLVSGEPHPGERAWREILKSDPAVDLVHFTILRLVESQDPARPEELSLIPFPTERLFGEELGGFDLVIFDRYRLRGVLRAADLEAVKAHVEAGGSLFIASGPEFAGPGSLADSPLRAVLPAIPAGSAQETAFRPAVTEPGRRHSVTAPLARAQGTAPRWGHWYRYLPVRQRAGTSVLAGPGGAPLLILAEAGKGRVAMLQSDQFWLWARGVEGGGPHVALLRRSLHWLMREPDLEPEALTAEVDADGALVITRRSLKPGRRALAITGPDGKELRREIVVDEEGTGCVILPAPRPGLYQITSGDIAAVAMVPDPDAREFDEIAPGAGRLAPVVTASRGSIHWLADGPPALSRTPGGGLWLPPRGAREVVTSRLQPLLPVWAGGLAALGLLIASWWVARRPGRRRTQTDPASGRSAKTAGSGGASASSG